MFKVSSSEMTGGVQPANALSDLNFLPHPQLNSGAPLPVMDSHPHLHVPTTRQQTYHLPPPSSLSLAQAQADRRALALQLQRSRRIHAFEAARLLVQQNRASREMQLELGGGMMDLGLGAAAGAGGGASVGQGQFADAVTDSEEEEDEEMPPAVGVGGGPGSAPSSTSEGAAGGHGKQQRRKRQREKSLYQPWARNLLTQGEVMQLEREGLPRGFESEWLLKVVPKGKRCDFILFSLSLPLFLAHLT